MTIALADRVKETTTTTGTGTLDLAGAATGFQGFVAGVGDAAEVYYAIVGQAGGGAEGEWEVGIGTVTDAATDTLSRDTVLASSNAGAAVNLSAGTKDVFLTAPADQLRYPIVGVARDFGGTQTLANTGGSWNAVDTDLDVTVPARVGDLIGVAVLARLSTSTVAAYLDAATLDSGGAVETYVSSGGSSPLSIGGQPGWGHNVSGGSNETGGESFLTLGAADVVNGEVTARLLYSVNGNSLDIRPSVFSVKNYGPS